VLARLRDAGIVAEEFSLHLPSLDEVFFTLTGTRSGSESPQADSQNTKEVAV
jgi:oleandomycin transport system ATP-binding protein